jgi:metal-responsive CopG/Arc/MetJ family transcriptional regulator
MDKKVGRPKVGEVKVIFPHSLAEALARAAEEKGLSRSAYIRMVLSENLRPYLEKTGGGGNG